jgi:hypothetical protein
MRLIYLTVTPTAVPNPVEILPITAKLMTSGVKYSKALARAVDSDVWFVVGDGKPIPAPLTITIYAADATTATLRTLESSIRGLALAATAILVKDRDGVIKRRDVAGLMEEPVSLEIGGTDLAISLTFAPIQAFWTNQDGTGAFAF